MKRLLLLLLAGLLVLTGCHREPAGETAPSTTAQTVETTQRIPGPSLYVPDSPMEQETDGAVRVFLPKEGTFLTYGFMGDDPVLLSATEKEYRVSRIHGDTGELLAEGTLPVGVDIWIGFGMGPDCLVCFDAEESLFRIYDGQFRQRHTVPAPEGITGTIVLSRDLSTAYYGVNGTLVAHDLHSGISRLVMQKEDAVIYAAGLLFDDSVIYCYVNEIHDAYDAFFSAADGRMLDREDSFMNMQTQGDFYVAQCSDGPVTEVLLGNRGETVRSFRADNEAGNVGVLQRTGRLVEQLSTEEGTALHIYSREQGHRQSALLLPHTRWVGTVLEDASGRLWFQTMNPEKESDILCCWDPTGAQGKDEVTRIGKYYTREDPDPEGLAQCALRAGELEKAYGVQISLYRDYVEPRDYAFTPEHQIRLISEGLDVLEKALSKFPRDFFRTAAGVTESGTFHISLVREMTGTEYNTLPDVGGLQYWIDGNAYVALKTTGDVERNFYHELCHALETFVIANSIHYDFWENNNPEDFRYDYSYNDYHNHADSPWLQDQTRAFIDGYSMTYPIEDRARILEYAITEGNEGYFATETMQAKLKQLCMAFREAFGWEKSQETFLWEQYLAEPLKMK